MSIQNISAGLDHSLVQTNNGHVFSFGFGEYGQLGHGNNRSSNTPRLINGIGEVSAIASALHSLVLLSNGHVFSFGFGENGQLGHGNNQSSNVPQRIVSYFVGDRIEELNNATAVSVGSYYSLILLSSGHVLSFGYGSFGQLGHGDNLRSNTPRLINGIENATNISAGGFHSLVLLSSGHVLSFGYGGKGQIGHGDNQSSNVPRRINGIENASKISAGDEHSLVLLGSGHVLSFGYGKKGQLGHGDNQSSNVPRRINVIENASKISAGSYYSLVLLSSGHVLSFGHGKYGQLGHGDNLNLNVPKIIAPRPIDSSPRRTTASPRRTSVLPLPTHTHRQTPTQFTPSEPVTLGTYEFDINQITTCYDPIMLEDTNMDLINSVTIVNMANPHIATCYEPSTFANLVRSADNKFYECIGRYFPEDGTRGMQFNRDRRFLALTLSTGVYYIPSENYTGLTLTVGNVYALVPVLNMQGRPLEISHTVSVNVADEGGSHIGGWHCQAGTNITVHKLMRIVPPMSSARRSPPPSRRSSPRRSPSPRI